MSILCFTLSGYLKFTHYWFLTDYARAGGDRGHPRDPAAFIRDKKLRLVFQSAFCPQDGLLVSYVVAGKTLQSQLDSPASAYRIDAQASLSPSQSVDILYESANHWDDARVDFVPPLV